jgi:hypothetical protein
MSGRAHRILIPHTQNQGNTLVSSYPGWYTHPTQANVQIYWNGEQWSGSRVKSQAQPGDPIFPDGTQLPAAPPGYSAVPTQKKKPTGCLGCLGVIVAVAVGLTIIFSVIGANRSAHPTDEDKQAESQVACEDVVKKNLKAPSTASFSNETATGTGGAYTVTGDVDSQNGFGAMIRNHFTCESDGSTVHLTSLG